MTDLLIVGGGPAGLSAAIKAKELGLENVLVIERNNRDGGILNQCIHSGFGIKYFKEELTGPEYAYKLSERARELNVDIKFNSIVLDIDENKNTKILSENGVEILKPKAIILAMGCRERPRGAINIPGDRCSGIFSAGTAQELMNLKGYTIGKEAVILGSGDIGLIMTRRLTFEGVKVKAVLEIMPYSSGLKRNIAQCIYDFNIPLYYNHTITEIIGKERVEAVKVSSVDENRNPIMETEKIISCDTVLFSVGLIPENEIIRNKIKMSEITGGAIVDNSYETSTRGVFSCGNTLHVHDIVDNVTFEAFKASANAVDYIRNNEKNKNLIKIETGQGVRYTIPNFIDINSDDENFDIKFRTDNIYKNKKIKVYINDEIIMDRKKKIMSPGEMEIISIAKDNISKKCLEKVLIKVGE